jgi:hypothetical protein
MKETFREAAIVAPEIPPIIGVDDDDDNDDNDGIGSVGRSGRTDPPRWERRLANVTVAVRSIDYLAGWTGWMDG